MYIDRGIGSFDSFFVHCIEEWRLAKITAILADSMAMTFFGSSSLICSGINQQRMSDRGRITCAQINLDDAG
jgi:hypothetical protein